MLTCRHFRSASPWAVAAILLGCVATATGSLQGDAEQAVRRAGFELEEVSVCVIDADTGRRLVDMLLHTESSEREFDAVTRSNEILEEVFLPVGEDTAFACYFGSFIAT